MAVGVVVQAGERRKASIESLRALAALSVLIFHVFLTAAPRGVAPAHPSIGYSAGLSGRYGVCLFFAISGYLLFRPFVHEHLVGGRKVKLASYARNRALRILPLYYAVLLMLFLGAGGRIHASEVLRYALFLENYSVHTINNVDPPMWSLVVEVQFYVLLPVLALALGRVGGNDYRRWISCVLALGVASYLARWALVWNRSASGNQLIWTDAFPTNFLFFVPGMLLAIVESRRAPSRPGLRAVGALLLWTAVIIAVPTRQAFETAVLVCSLLVLSACVSTSGGVRVLQFRPLALLGVISYSVYLWHDNFVLLLVPHRSYPLVGLAKVLLIAIPWAAVSYVVIERPFLRLRRASSVVAVQRDRVADEVGLATPSQGVEVAS